MTKIQFEGDVAARYDEDHASMFRSEVVEPAVDLLAALAGDGAALEFAVGTGRLALPLSERGVPVHGIDNAAAMLDALRAKPGAERLDLTLGDIATTRVEGAFRLVYLAFNTITNLTSQEQQVACFENAAAHLEVGGCFVVEVYVPGLRGLPPGERIKPFDLRENHLGFDEYRDFDKQLQVSHHYWIEGDKMRSFAAPFRWVWPSELDLMARIAGLRLRERFAGWDRAAFDGESESHVSVWEKRV